LNELHVVVSGRTPDTVLIRSVSECYKGSEWNQKIKTILVSSNQTSMP